MRCGYLHVERALAHRGLRRSSATPSVRGPEDLLGLLDDLRDPERLAPGAGVGLGIDEELGPDQHQEVAEVDLRDQYPAVAPENLLGVRGKWVQVAEVGLGGSAPLAQETLDGTPDRSVGGNPHEDQQVPAI